jgi:hypothetical protein
MISLNSRLYSFPEYEAGWSPRVPHCSCLPRRIGDRLFLVNNRFEHGLMVGVSFPNNSIASVLSFVPFTARQAEYQRLGWALSHLHSLFNKSHGSGG